MPNRDFPSSENSPVVLVTGGARRLGASLCRGFASAGWRVLIHCNRSVAEAEALASELGDPERSRVLTADFLRCDAAEFLSGAFHQFGRLDCLINNASSYLRRGKLEELSEEDFSEDFAINFKAPFALMRAYARMGRPGVILNLLDGRLPKQEPSCAGYLLAKRALREATELCAYSWGNLGIRVNGIAPGLIRPKDGVPFSAMEPLVRRLPLPERTSEEEVVKAALYLVESETITGTVLYVDSGLHLSGSEIGEK